MGLSSLFVMNRLKQFYRSITMNDFSYAALMKGMANSMIYTVTFNPSLDYMVQVTEFELGKLHRTLTEDLYVGGKGINVSTVLKRLGIDSVAMGFTAGFTGAEIERQLVQLGISTDFIKVSQGLSRINIKLKSNGNLETEVNGQGPVIDRVEFDQFTAKLDRVQQGDIFILSGSVPKGIRDRDSIYSQVCRQLKVKNVKLVVDAEGDLLRNTLSYRPFLIKPNHLELGKLFGKELITIESMIECAKQLQKDGAVNVLVSMAGDGAFLLDEYGEVYRQAAPKGEVKNSVGAGDSMVAGFLAGIMSTNQRSVRVTPTEYRKALQFGVAAGSAAAFSEGLPDRSFIEDICHNLSM